LAYLPLNSYNLNKQFPRGTQKTQERRLRIWVGLWNSEMWNQLN
jgi:hypothetical protein